MCSDRYAAQLEAEAAFVRGRPGWRKLHLHCEVHKSTSCLSKGLSLNSAALAGMIRLALSLRCGGWMRIFRRCWFKEVFETIQVYGGVSTPEATAHHKRVTWIFTCDGPRRKLVQSILGALPNGDWGKPDV
eukprot:8555014-Pyramimonas_sp.AAC.1